MARSAAAAKRGSVDITSDPVQRSEGNNGGRNEEGSKEGDDVGVVTRERMQERERDDTEKNMSRESRVHACYPGNLHACLPFHLSR
jgi:hypothetical protein